MTRQQVHEYDAGRVAAAEEYARVETARAMGEGFRTSARAARAVPNLESSPRLSSLPGYSVTVFDFGGGVVEARAVFVDARRSMRAPRDITVERSLRPESDDKREWRMRRAKRTLKHRCLALKADHMITLTKRGKFATVDEAREAFRAFYKLLSRFPNIEFRYVAVPEHHADGETYHLHVAVQGRYDVVFLRRLWYRALGGTGSERGEDTPGSINIRYFSHKRKASQIVAGYMSKYMGKSFADIGGRGKSYWCTQGLRPLTVQRIFEPFGDCAHIRVRDIVAPMAPANTKWRFFQWEYVGLHGFVMSTH